MAVAGGLDVLVELRLRLADPRLRQRGRHGDTGGAGADQIPPDRRDIGVEPHPRLVVAGRADDHDPALALQPEVATTAGPELASVALLDEQHRQAELTGGELGDDVADVVPPQRRGADDVQRLLLQVQRIWRLLRWLLEKPSVVVDQGFAVRRR